MSPYEYMCFLNTVHEILVCKFRLLLHFLEDNRPWELFTLIHISEKKENYPSTVIFRVESKPKKCVLLWLHLRRYIRQRNVELIRGGGVRIQFLKKACW